MKVTRIMTVAMLIVAGSGLLLHMARAQQAGVMRIDVPQSEAAGTVFIVPAAGSSDGVPLRETVTVAADEPIPNVPGKRLVSLIVEYPPGASSAAHSHASSAFIYAYVLSGEILSQVDNEPARVYRTGESWFENPGAHHRVSANASDAEPAQLLAVFIVDAADDQLTTSDHQ